MNNIWGRRLPFPFNLFQQENNATYHLECKKCGWQKTYRIFSGTGWYVPGVTPSGNMVKTKRELPSVCPECGGRVKKYKLPCLIKE
ncbi:MAG: hypothetical protein WC721_15610 [Victivallaceae bacterium]|jgi:predicted nucleic acid-binding Zn ribbon protein